MREATRRGAARRGAARRDGAPRSSEYVVACLLRGEPDSRGFAGISGTQMSAGTRARTVAMETQYTADRDARGPSKRNDNMSVINRAEFPPAASAIPFARDKGAR